MSEPTFHFRSDADDLPLAEAVLDERATPAEQNLANAKAFVWLVAGLVLLGASIPLVVLAWRAAF